MTTTMIRNGSRTPARPAPTETLTPARRPRRWNTTRALVGVVVIAICTIGAMTLFSSAADRTSVIVLARDVPAGAVIAESDLGSVSVSAGSRLKTVPTAGADRVVGRTAAADLAAGSLLNPDQVIDAPALPAGTVVASAVLKDGQAPVDLAVGDVVDIVETTAVDAFGVGEARSRGTGQVVALSHPGDGENASVVSLAVPSDAAVAVSAAGAAGRLSLVVAP